MLTVEQMRIRKKNLGYTYDMIAEKSGLPKSTVQKVLSGITECPRYATLAALDNVLGVYAFYPYKDGAQGMAYGKEEEQVYTAAEKAAEYKAAAAGRFSDPFSVRSFLPRKEQGEYTTDDLDALPENVRAELIDGVIYGLAAPSRAHQLLVGAVFNQIYNYISSGNGSCEVLTAPFDVRIGSTKDFDDRKNSVQPDIIVNCREERFRGNLDIIGAPDMIVEVLSPSTAVKDCTVKSVKYKTHGVREYWIVDPRYRTVNVFCFEEDLYESYSFNEKIPVGIYNGDLRIDLSGLITKLDAIMK